MAADPGLSDARTRAFVAASLACPVCHTRLEHEAAGYRCPRCPRTFPVVASYVDFRGKRLQRALRASGAAVLGAARRGGARLLGAAARVLTRLVASPRRCLDIGRSLMAEGRIKPHLVAYE